METTCLLIDSVALLLVLLYSLRNEREAPGSPEQGFFRMRETVPKRDPAPPARRARAL